MEAIAARVEVVDIEKISYPSEKCWDESRLNGCRGTMHSPCAGQEPGWYNVRLDRFGMKMVHVRHLRPITETSGLVGVPAGLVAAQELRTQAAAGDGSERWHGS